MEVKITKKYFRIIISLLSLLSLPWAIAETDTPPAEIATISRAQKTPYEGGLEHYVVPLTIRNNTKDWLGGLTYKLYIFNKERKKIYEVARQEARIGFFRDERQMFWKGGKLKGSVTIAQDIILPKSFGKIYGRPEYCVVELLLEGKIIDVKSQPRKFFEYKGKNERIERIEEWKEIKKRF